MRCCTSGAIFGANKPGQEKAMEQAILDHITDIGSASPEVYSWDVINEPIIQPHLLRYLRGKKLDALILWQLGWQQRESQRHKRRS